MSLEESKQLRDKLFNYVFKDNIVKNPNRKKLTIIEQNADEIIVDVSYADVVEQEGSIIDQDIMNAIRQVVVNAYDNAVTTKETFEAENISSVYVNDKYIQKFCVENMVDKLSNQINKSISFTSGGYIKIGKFKVNNTNITIDITSSANKAKYAKLVLSCQNHLLVDSVVYNDDENVIAPRIFIKPSSQEDSYVEIYFMPENNSENIINIKSSMIREIIEDISSKIVGIENAFEIVEEKPDDATITPRNITYENLKNIWVEINKMKNGSSVFTLLKANTIDLIDEGGSDVYNR